MIKAFCFGVVLIFTGALTAQAAEWPSIKFNHHSLLRHMRQHKSKKYKRHNASILPLFRNEARYLKYQTIALRADNWQLLTGASRRHGRGRGFMGKGWRRRRPRPRRQRRRPKMPQPTTKSGGASWVPPVGPGVEPQQKKRFSAFQASENASRWDVTRIC